MDNEIQNDPVPDIWMKRPGTPERIHEPDFGWKITLTSTSAKLELKWLRSSKRKCLAKVKGMKGKGNISKGRRPLDRPEFNISKVQQLIGHMEFNISKVQRLIGRMEFNILKVQRLIRRMEFNISKVQRLIGRMDYGIQHFEGFLLWHWCGLSIDYRISDKYRLSLNNNCAFINK
ncbi:unnamed protein product [Rhizophagus irregularis]|nr:unnamed protein product [Rhizophagus irregularis]